MTRSEFTIKGFKGSAVKAQIKYKDRLDLGLIYSERPARVASVFTRNSVKAAPVKKGIELLSAPDTPILRALLVNSGNANACTGIEGMRRLDAILSELSEATGIPPKECLMCSTGVIGEQLPLKRFHAAIPTLVKDLTPHGLLAVAEAILTTDTHIKVTKHTLELGGDKRITMLGMAKGAGMIAPKLGPPSATMLAFILTDAWVEPAFMQHALERATESSFNRITVDGDTSTNDTVILLSNGANENTEEIVDGTPLARAFQTTLDDICMELAKKIVEDGEGATKCVTIEVIGARSTGDARQIAEAIANSPLVKTAFYGEDPNWGRILASAGKTLLEIDETRVRLSIDDVPIFENGLGLGPDCEERARARMKNHEFTVTLDLGLGDKNWRMLTTDLSKQYVSINADYRS